MRLIPLRDLLIVLAIGLFLGTVGPYGTFRDLTPVERYGYWVGSVAVAWAHTALILHWIGTWPVVTRAPRPLVVALAGIAAAIPTTFVVAWLESLLRVGQPWPLHALPRLYGSVAFITVCIAFVWQGLRRADRAALPSGPAQPAPPPDIPTAPASSPTAPGTPPALLRRLPALHGRAILALQAEDHYLRVHTDHGSELVLLRLGDALAEMAGVDGLQVHRSWWVARSSVRGIERAGGRMVLVLTNGLHVPVSRTYLLAVRAAGWSDPAEARLQD